MTESLRMSLFEEVPDFDRIMAMTARRSRTTRRIELPIEQVRRARSVLGPGRRLGQARDLGYERLSSRIDRGFGFESHDIHGLAKMKTRIGLALTVMMALALGQWGPATPSGCAPWSARCRCATPADPSSAFRHRQSTGPAAGKPRPPL